MSNRDQRQTQQDSITEKLAFLLADELRMDVDEIDTDQQFVDLGLDSITGVTWIRRINEAYATDIEAIMVYTYPTLAALSEFVFEQAQSAGTLPDAIIVEPAPQPAPQAVSPAPQRTAQEAAPLASNRTRSRTVSASANRTRSRTASTASELSRQYSDLHSQRQ